MFRNLRQSKAMAFDLVASKLFDHETFYDGFLKDLSRAKDEVIIESPFMTTRRVSIILSVLIKSRRRGVRIIVNTRDPLEQEGRMRLEAMLSIDLLQDAGVSVFLTGGHHRKLAIIDKKILWEGSLNIFSQNDSCEIMRRIESERLATQMIGFIKLDKHLS